MPSEGNEGKSIDRRQTCSCWGWKHEWLFSMMVLLKRVNCMVYKIPSQ